MNGYIISVIIPIYNTEKYLSRCIESVLAQTFNKIEIVLIDDGSIDNSYNIAKQYSEKYENIKAISQENRGTSEARKAGINNSSGKYIMFLDSDDMIPPNSISDLYNKCILFDLDIAFGVMSKFIKNNIPQKYIHPIEGILTRNSILSYFLDNNCKCSMVAAVSKREIWTDDIFLKKFLKIPNEDVFINIKLTQNINKCGIFNDIDAYKYMHNPESTTSRKTYFKQELWNIYFHELREFLRSINCLEKYEHNIRIIEIDRIAFYTQFIDKNDIWIKSIYQYDTCNFPIRTKILHRLIKYPLICQICIKGNRSIKNLITNVISKFR